MTFQLIDPMLPRPLSFAQERLWLIEQFSEDKSLYNTAIVFELSGSLDVSVLEQSFTELMKRHEVLRTGFEMQDGAVRICLAEPAPIALVVHDLRQMPEAREWAKQDQARVLRLPFDLARPPLLRAHLYREHERRHQLAITVHHMVFDGASTEVLMKELASIYAALRAGTTHELPSLPLQMHEAAARERTRMQGARREALLQYWTHALAGELAVLSLPSDRPRPLAQTHRGATLCTSLSADWMAGLEQACRRERVTPFMYVLAAYAAWLGAYSGQQDLLIGSPFNLRSDAESQSLIGYLVNTVALRVRLQGRSSFRQLLCDVRSTCLQAYQHGELPFGDLVAALGGQRDLAHTPVFQSMLVVQSRKPTVQLGPELSLRCAGEVPAEHARFDLVVVLDPQDSGARLSMEYSSDLFDVPTAERMLAHFQALLSDAIENPGKRTDELHMLSRAERERAIVTWNATGGQAQQGLAHQLFDAQARANPQAIALISGTTVWRYGELQRRANQLANRLRSRGVGPEVPVAVLLERGPELVCSMLAIFKAGGVYLPLDPALPDERIAFMIGDSRPQQLITGSGQRRRCTAFEALFVDAACVWDWDHDSAELAEQAERAPAPAFTACSLAYIIYTSGSTGRPKGVEVTHAAFYNLVLAKIEGFGVDPDSCVLQFVSFGFDVSVSDVCMTLAAGARLLLRPAEIVGGDALASFLREQAVSIIVLPASVLATIPCIDLPDLKSVIAGGEACSAALVDRWAPGRRFINAYGPTEATICTTMATCKPDGGAPSIGRPIPHARVYVLNSNLEPVPPGVTGEIYIGGAGVARAYRGRPGLSAERFIPDPFAGLDPSIAPGSRLYRTGDHARYLTDGSISFVERIDEQVKIRGFRIELGEIEAALTQIDGIQDAVVSTYTSGPGGKQLVAYVVALDAVAIDTQSLLQALRSKLPEHMVPSRIIPLPEFVRTPNGKVDRQALPAPTTRVPTGGADSHIAPRNVIEEVLAALYGEVLGVPDVSVEHDFFALGGHSILAAQLIARASDRFELGLSLRLAFEAPSVAALALRIEALLTAQIDSMNEAEVAQELSQHEPPPKTSPRAIEGIRV
ncbi:amino acid adenylation domain-containing protein [Paucibacter sp. APW11]|uniref:Amino acid adenylation domain-containing protein n=1 Tax=Roseateles aquae TaxID=3077235 RepID=A0ABU3P940_9BURK|nr:amino acid adenylation domain-containing protein [Paucibacter sp. APW11]MDT8999091.1 amino acid adenylation domain-containing protein [Paucibacter sp. APW11]